MNKNNLIELDPSIIYFTHSKLRKKFSDGKLVEETLKEILDGNLKVEDLPKIKVMYDPATERYISMNNRRLWVIKQLNSLGKCQSIMAHIEYVKSNSKLTKNTYSLTAKLELH